MEKVEKQKLHILKKTLKKGVFLKNSKTTADISKSLPPKTTSLPTDPKKAQTEISSSIPNKVLVLEDKTEYVITTQNILVTELLTDFCHEIMTPDVTLKETCNSYFCVIPKDHRLMFVSLKY